MGKKRVLTVEELTELLGEDCLEVINECGGPPERLKLPSKSEIYEVSKMLKVISSEPKLEMLALLSQMPLPVCAISKLVGKDQSLVSHHLSHLRMVGLVRESRMGKFKIYRVDEEALTKVCSTIERVLRGTARVSCVE